VAHDGLQIVEVRLPFEQERGRSEARVLDPRPASRAKSLRRVRSAPRELFVMPFAILNYDSRTNERKRTQSLLRRHVSMACSHGPTSTAGAAQFPGAEEDHDRKMVPYKHKPIFGRTKPNCAVLSMCAIKAGGRREAARHQHPRRSERRVSAC